MEAFKTIRHVLWWSFLMSAMSFMETHGGKIGDLVYKMWTYEIRIEGDDAKILSKRAFP